VWSFDDELASAVVDRWSVVIEKSPKDAMICL